MDLEPGKEGGTWLGITKDGKFATLTNYKQAQQFVNSSAIGRGYLVPDFLKGNDSVREYLQRISDGADNYNGFNLLLGQLSLHGKTVMGYYSNIEETVINMLSPGIHVLSNKTLNCSWPKMVYGRKRFSEILDENCSKQVLIDKLIELLCAQERLVPIIIVVPNSNCLGIKGFFSGISISFQCECHIIMQIQNTKNLIPRRF